MFQKLSQGNMVFVSCKKKKLILPCKKNHPPEPFAKGQVIAESVKKKLLISQVKIVAEAPEMAAQFDKLCAYLPGTVSSFG
jgi:hypothetical protein